MSLSQIIFGVLLAVVLLLLSVFYGLRQMRVLRELRGKLDLPGDEAQYVRRQALRRLASSALMFVLAGLLVGALAFLETRAEQLAEANEAIRNAGGDIQYNPSDRVFVKVYGWYWLLFLVVLLAVVVLAAVDFWAIQRYGRRHYRKLQEDRRAMIERQVVRLRQERNSLN